MKTPNYNNVVLLPKGAVTEGKESRNPVLELFDQAGFPGVRKGFAPSARNRTDEVYDKDSEILFRAVKGAPALAAQFELFRDQSVAVLMGSDVLAEADQRVRQYGVRPDIVRLLSLGIGPCTLQMLAPVEQPISSPEDVERRLFFTKYPYLMRRLLQVSGSSAAVRTTDGADTRVTEYRKKSPRRRIGAFEIVGTGETARANGLQIVGPDAFAYPSGADMDMPYLDLMAVRTDLYLSNISRMGQGTREMMQRLGLAFESAREQNTYTSFKFNIPKNKADLFREFGMKGPTPSQSWWIGDVEWLALEVCVPTSQQNETRLKLMQRGAEDVLSLGQLRGEVAAGRSEVLAVLPLDAYATETVEITDRNDEIAGWLTGLRDTVALRDAQKDVPQAKPSSTINALKQGREFCVAKFVGEIAELSRAVRKADRPETILEAGQAVYWLMVSLQSRGVSFEQVVDGMAKESQPGGVAEKLGAAVRNLRAGIRLGDLDALNGTGYMLDQGVNGAAVSLVDQATEFSTAINKLGDAEAVAESAEALKGIICLCELAGVNFDEVMDKEMGK